MSKQYTTEQLKQLRDKTDAEIRRREQADDEEAAKVRRMSDTEFEVWRKSQRKGA